MLNGKSMPIFNADFQTAIKRRDGIVLLKRPTASGQNLVISPGFTTSALRRGARFINGFPKIG